MDLASKGWCVFGLRGSGKSWFVKSVLESTPDHLIFDPLKEHSGYNRVVPTDRTSIDELETVIKGPVIKGFKVTEDNKAMFPTRRVGETWKPECFVIDEANRFIQAHPKPMPQAVADLVDYGRHWSVSFGVVARRPVQFNSTLVELSDHVFFFNLPGKNDHAYLESLHSGLGDTVRNLAPHHFVAFSHGTEITVHAPIRAPRHPTET
jgi:DNA helicase HerA-like ATPase